MDDVGNVLVKRITRGTAVSIKNTTEESTVSNDILKLSFFDRDRGTASDSFDQNVAHVVHFELATQA